MRSGGGTGLGTGQPAIADLRELLRTGQPRQASSTVGLLSRLSVTTLLELLPSRIPQCNGFTRM